MPKRKRVYKLSGLGTFRYTDCQIHKVSTGVTWALKVSEKHISGLIACSLVLRQAGALALFRKELLAEISSSLLVVHGHGQPPDGAAKDFREQVYAMFLSTTVSRPEDLSAVQKRRALQRAILNRFLCGDLEDPNVQFFTGPIDATEGLCLQAIEKLVIPALVPGSMPTYARHRWPGGEQAVDFIGLLESHHKLFSRTVRRMYKIEQPLPVSSDVAALQLDGWEALEDQSLRQLHEEQSDPATDMFLEADGVLNEAPSTKDANDWAEFNKSMQKKMQAWAGKQDLSVLALLRRVMNISSKLLFELLKRSSKQWDIEQEQAACHGRERKYRLAEAFLGNELDNAVGDIRAVFHEQPPAVPAKSKTRTHRVLLFTMLSRLSGALEFFIGSLQEGYPYRCAGLLLDQSEGMAETVMELPACMQDRFSAELFARYPTPKDLLSKECLCILHAAFDLCELDVAGIECRHAAVRHLLDQKSSTWDVLLPTLSADFLLRQTTIQNAELLALLHGMPLRGNIPKNELQSAKKVSRRKRRLLPSRAKASVSRTGGGQRAFFGMHLGEMRRRMGAAGLGACYKRMHAAYRSLPADEAAHYEQLGRAAAISRKAGVKPLKRKPANRTKATIDCAMSLLDDGQQVLKVAEQGVQVAVKEKQQKQAAAQALLSEKRHSLMLSEQQPAVAPFSHLVPDVADAPCKSFHWCSPAADLAKARCTRSVTEGGVLFLFFFGEVSSSQSVSLV